MDSSQDQPHKGLSIKDSLRISGVLWLLLVGTAVVFGGCCIVSGVVWTFLEPNNPVAREAAIMSLGEEEAKSRVAEGILAGLDQFVPESYITALSKNPRTSSKLSELKIRSFYYDHSRPRLKALVDDYMRNRDKNELRKLISDPEAEGAKFARSPEMQDFLDQETTALVELCLGVSADK